MKHFKGWLQFLVVELMYAIISLAMPLHCPASCNFVSAVTTKPISMKLQRKHPLNVLTWIPSKHLDPLRTLTARHDKGAKSDSFFKKSILFLWICLLDFHIFTEGCFLGDPLPDSLKSFGSIQNFDCGAFKRWPKEIKNQSLLRFCMLDFHYITQGCSLCDILPNSLKSFGSI